MAAASAVNKTSGAAMSMFKGYDLNALGVPLEARAREGGNYVGRHGYTITSSNGAVTWLPCQALSTLARINTACCYVSAML